MDDAVRRYLSRVYNYKVRKVGANDMKSLK